MYDPDPAARICYAAIRQLREEQGYPRGPVWGLLVREEQRWFRDAALRAWRGWVAHEIQGAWREELVEDGWTVAPEIDHVKRTHPELDPWEHLEEKFRRRFVVLQLMAAGLDLPLTPGETDLSRVIAS
jgi:hypothetical protein